MLPLRVAILWHQHQPYYKKEETFILPWVRLHGAKDYYDLPAILREFPQIKQTFNLAPSLMLQIEEYCSNTTRDRIQNLTEKSAEDLTESDKKDILKSFFQCNQELMMLPYERYRELFEGAMNVEIAIEKFIPQDWRDIQTWYNLTWIGQLSRGDKRVRELFKKGRNFSEEDKHQVLEIHREILEKILPEMKYLHNKGQIEISVTPLYHPILPLVIDNHSMLEALPNAILPDVVFSRPEDADMQIVRAVEYYQSRFGDHAIGMWPSEGSVSNAALSLMAKNGIKWVATDEDILWASVKDTEHHWTDKYFPRKVPTEHGDIAVLFRDHALSDAVGFVYSRWDANHAADDFCRRLRDIRDAIVKQHGEESLSAAVVPIMLDGENCWEYYYQNGTYFLRALYERLSAEEFETVTCGEGAKYIDYLPPVNSVRAGSWINANFKIWIGHYQDNAAWTMLAKARSAIAESILHPKYQLAYEHILIAEGSDWCWWYGDDHSSPNQQEFDELFRWNIAEAYLKVDLIPPDNVFHSILGVDSKIHDEWANAEVYQPDRAGSAMHSVGDAIRKIFYRRKDNLLELRLDIERQLKEDESVSLNVESKLSHQNFSYKISNSLIAFEGISGFNIHSLRVFHTEDQLYISLPIPLEEIQFSIQLNTSEGENTYPPNALLTV